MQGLFEANNWESLWVYLPCLFLQLFCIVLMFFRRDIYFSLGIFIFFLTTYYAFPFLVFLSGGGQREYMLARNLDSSLYALSGACFIAIFILLVIWQNRVELKEAMSLPFWSKIVIWFSIGLCFFWGSFFLKHPVWDNPDFLALKDTISMTLLLVFATVFSILLSSSKGPTIKVAFVFVGLVSLVILALAVYEISHDFTWARTSVGNGREVVRANSVFFNPNVMGIWFAFLGIWGLHLMPNKNQRVRAQTLLLLSVLGIFLSGARSALILVVLAIGANLFIQIITRQPVRDKWLGSWSYFGWLGLVCIAPFSTKYFGFSGFFQAASEELAIRFIQLPNVLLRYVFGLNNDGEDVAYLAARQSIDGRLSLGGGSGSDNAYIAIAFDIGLFGFAVWCVLFCYIGYLVVMSLIRNPSTNNSTIGAIFLVIIASGFFLRTFQVFPVWGMISLMLSVVLAQLARRQMPAPQ